MNTSVPNINKKLYDLSVIYADVKNALLLSENLTRDKQIGLSSINEMRNALDHIMRSYIEKNNSDIHFEKAKGHLYRAGYDAYEILAIDVAQSIKNSLVYYKPETIVSVMPEYYSDVIPKVSELERKLVNARANKTIYDDKEGHIDPCKIEKPYLEYQTHLEELIKIDEKITKLMPSFEAKRKDIKKSTIFDKGMNFLVVLIAGLIGAAVMSFMQK